MVQSIKCNDTKKSIGYGLKRGMLAKRELKTKRGRGGGGPTYAEELGALHRSLSSPRIESGAGTK